MNYDGFPSGGSVFANPKWVSKGRSNGEFGPSGTLNNIWSHVCDFLACTKYISLISILRFLNRWFNYWDPRCLSQKGPAEGIKQRLKWLMKRINHKYEYQLKEDSHGSVGSCCLSVQMAPKASGEICSDKLKSPWSVFHAARKLNSNLFPNSTQIWGTDDEDHHMNAWRQTGFCSLEIWTYIQRC